MVKVVNVDWQEQAQSLGLGSWALDSPSYMCSFSFSYVLKTYFYQVHDLYSNCISILFQQLSHWRNLYIFKLFFFQCGYINFWILIIDTWCLIIVVNHWYAEKMTLAWSCFNQRSVFSVELLVCMWQHSELGLKDSSHCCASSLCTWPQAAGPAQPLVGASCVLPTSSLCQWATVSGPAQLLDSTAVGPSYKQPQLVRGVRPQWSGGCEVRGGSWPSLGSSPAHPALGQRVSWGPREQA